jgi:hypothetical protein
MVISYIYSICWHTKLAFYERQQWPHTDEHLTLVDEDRHQNDGVWRQVLQLEPLELQRCEEEGGHRWHKPSRGVAGEED